MSPARRSTKRKKKPATPPPRTDTPVEMPLADRTQRLGNKHTCFSCGAKFYDLNKPEPVCPKCQTNQLEKPKEAAAPKPSPPKPAKPRGRDLSLLAEEERSSSDGNSEEYSDNSDNSDLDLDLDLGEDDEKLFDESEEADEDES